MHEQPHAKWPKLTPAMRAVLHAVASATENDGETTSRKVSAAAQVAHGTACNYLAILTRAGLIQARAATYTGRHHGRLHYYRATDQAARALAAEGDA